MPTFTVTVDTTKYVAGVRELEAKQLPFVMAKTLTDTAKDGQAEVKRNVRAAFKLRNTWTEQGIRIKPADKKGNSGRIEADVHTDTANRRTGAPDYLGRQEEGGEKVPYGGHQYIAVPTKYLRRMAPGVIPAELRPKNLLGAVGGRFTTRGKNGQMALRNQKRVRDFVFFLAKLKQGDMAIMGRYFVEREAYPFYLLIPHARVKRSALEMEKAVERVINDRFGRHWDENWRATYASGLRI
jgi:hypothetical protein